MLITIITTTYNCCDSISDTIQSIRSLNAKGLEFIIIDGGSSDGTLDVIKHHSKDFPIKLLSEPDRGIYDAMNKGWALAEEDHFILFLGAGDKILSLPDELPVSGCDALVGDVFYEGNKLFQGKWGYCLRLRNSIHHQALLVRKSFHPSPPFDISFKVLADFDFNQRLMKRGARFVHSPQFRSFALPGGVSSVYPLREALIITRKNFGSLWSATAFIYFVVRRIGVRLKRGLKG